MLGGYRLPGRGSGGEVMLRSSSNSNVERKFDELQALGD